MAISSQGWLVGEGTLRLGPPGRGQQTRIFVRYADELQSERQATRTQAGGEGERRRAEQRPAGAEAWVAGCLRTGSLAGGRRCQHGVKRPRPLPERVDQALALFKRRWKSA